MSIQSQQVWHYSRKDLTDVISLRGKASKCTTAEYSMRMTAKQVVSLGIQLSRFYQSDWKVGTVALPQLPLANPLPARKRAENVTKKC